MTAARRLAAILAADVSVGEHRDGRSKQPQSDHHRNQQGACRTRQGLRGEGEPCEGRERPSFRPAPPGWAMRTRMLPREANWSHPDESITLWVERR
jgi:hypothetical protein